MLHLQCPSGCYRRFVILLAVRSPSFGQLLCPSRHFVHYFLRSASLHLVRSLTICCKARHPFAYHKSKHWAAPAFPQASPTILTGFHSASLRHSFTSVAFSPPAANNFARRLSPLRLRSLKCCSNTQTLEHGSFVPHFAMQH